MSITTAIINWQTDHLGNTVPTSDVFDDVYFSHAGGLAESHYVFIEGNDLPNRLENLNSGETFVVAETGFGTGLNFLALCQSWQSLKSQGKLNQTARLHFISTEKFPLSQADLTKALSSWEQSKHLGEFIQALIEQYPLPLAGCHRLNIRDDIVLDLWLGDALESFGTLYAQMTRQNTSPKINAWFLDGFAPSKNSELWSDELFSIIKQLSANDATLATFTAAGFVRRRLHAVGFEMSKRQGFGRKREMLIGKLATQTADNVNTNNLQNIPKEQTRPQHIAIIGTGISGLCTAYALAKRGIHITLLDKNAPLAGASGNPCALFAPKLSIIEQANHHLSTVSFLFAERFYRQLNTQGDVFSPLGVVDFLLPTQKSRDKLQQLIAPYPDELIHEISPIYPDQLIHTIIPKAGLVSPKALAQVVLSHPLILWRQAHITKIAHNDTGVELYDDNPNLPPIKSDHAIISAGFESHRLHDTLFNPRKIRGQVSWLHLDKKTFDRLPDHPIKYDGYCAKFTHDDTHQFLMGASFVRNCTDTAIYADEHTFNIDKLTQSLPTIADELNLHQTTLHGRASIRAQTPDYHPIIGKIDTRIHTIYGMGSKGFTFAPLCGEIIAGMICDETLPISDELLAKISPARPRLTTPLTDNEQ